jgi:prepilin-type processing-associated H-X9-DG protein
VAGQALGDPKVIADPTTTWFTADGIESTNAPDYRHINKNAVASYADGHVATSTYLGIQVPQLFSPVVSYGFNKYKSTNTVENDGSATDGALTLYDNANSPANRLSADATGVSGRPGDCAFDNTVVGGMGSAVGTTANYGRGQTAAPVATLANFKSFTIVAWYKSNVTPNNLARVIDNVDASNNGLGMRFAVSNQVIDIQMNSISYDGLVQDALFQKSDNQWYFIAETCDVTKPAGSAIFYFNGSTTADVRQVEALPVWSSGGQNIPINLSARPVVVGNRFDYIRPFKGYLDNVRIYGTASSDGTGALTLAQLKQVRAYDLVNGAL